MHDRKGASKEDVRMEKNCVRFILSSLDFLSLPLQLVPFVRQTPLLSMKRLTLLPSLVRPVRVQGREIRRGGAAAAAGFRRFLRPRLRSL